MAIAQTKVYDGEPFATVANSNVLSDAQFSIGGLVGNDQNLTVTGLTATAAQGASLVNANENGFQVTPSADGAMIGEGNTAILLATNYTVTARNTTWKITKRPVTLTLSDVKMTKGDDFPYVFGQYPAIDKDLLAASGTQEAPVTPIAVQRAFTVVPPAQQGGNPTYAPISGIEYGALTIGHEEKLQAAYDLLYANAAAQGTQGQPGYVAAEPLYGITASGQNANIEIKTYAEAIKAVAANQPDDVCNNYNVTIVKGNLIVSGASFTAMPVVQNKIEYSEEYEVSVYAYGVNGEATIDAKNAEFVFEKINADGTTTAVNGKPVERGNYKVKIKEGTITGTGDFANVTPTLVPGSFSIIQKTIMPNTFAQTVHTGDAISTIGDNITYTNNKQFVDGKAPKLWCT